MPFWTKEFFLFHTKFVYMYNYNRSKSFSLHAFILEVNDQTFKRSNVQTIKWLIVCIFEIFVILVTHETTPFHLFSFSQTKNRFTPINQTEHTWIFIVIMLHNIFSNKNISFSCKCVYSFYWCEFYDTLKLSTQ